MSEQFIKDGNIFSYVDYWFNYVVILMKVLIGNHHTAMIVIEYSVPEIGHHLRQLFKERYKLTSHVFAVQVHRRYEYIILGALAYL